MPNLNQGAEKYGQDTIDERLANWGQTVSSHINLLSSYDDSTPAYTRNTNCYMAIDVDGESDGFPVGLEGACMYVSTGSNKYGINLITPRHFATADHLRSGSSIGVGTTVRYVTKTNTVYTRTISDLSAVADDICIGKFDSDLPADVPFFKVLPADWRTYYPHIRTDGVTTNPFSVPMFIVDKERNCHVADWFEDNNSLGRVFSRAPTDATRLAYYDGVVTGDSGGPFGLIVNGSAVLLASLYSGGWGGNGYSGTSIARYHDEVNAELTSLGGGYQLTDVDLTVFPRPWGASQYNYACAG